MKTSNRTEDFIPYKAQQYSKEEMIQRSKDYYEYFDQRRSLREFSDKEVPFEVIENIIKTASTAPSGAHKQPWTFCIVKDQEMKRKIREAAEEEEKINYSGRMGDEWLDDLKVFATNEVKEFLTVAPYLIIVCKKSYDLEEDGGKAKNYYVNESVGLAAGFLLTAIHNAGLVALTHTPSPMGFLTKILDRPENEKPFLLIPVGYPADDAHVPNLSRKGLEDVMVVY
ncbi:MAG: nitroreductase family protein [Crocinitomicaceae bacterium]|nr:nitroreductase family protein [Crocinitomicaceae bacterium]